MSTSANRSPRSVEELAPADRERLELAFRRLRQATKNYEPFLGGALGPNHDATVHDADAMAAAQTEVQDAERDLWKLREELIGWARPAWAPRATLVADWDSVEDRIYDEA
ncbi:MAG: hypothetical protein MUP97_07135 [Acidimicrobiia bacterium]|nr:hypothetical protein [Acidimicrobiia bacterium]